MWLSQEYSPKVWALGDMTGDGLGGFASPMMTIGIVYEKFTNKKIKKKNRLQETTKKILT